MRRDVSRAERDGLLELLLGRLGVPIIEKVDIAERAMPLGQAVVEGERTEGGGFGFRERLLRRQVTVVAEQNVGIGHAGMRPRVLRILEQGQLEVMQTLVQPLPALSPVMAS